MKHITKDMVRKEVEALNTLLEEFNGPIRNISANYASQYGGWEISCERGNRSSLFFYSRIPTQAAYYFLQGYSISFLDSNNK